MTCMPDHDTYFLGSMTEMDDNRGFRVDANQSFELQDSDLLLET